LTQCEYNGVFAPETFRGGVNSILVHNLDTSALALQNGVIALGSGVEYGSELWPRGRYPEAMIIRTTARMSAVVQGSGDGDVAAADGQSVPVGTVVPLTVALKFSAPEVAVPSMLRQRPVCIERLFDEVIEGRGGLPEV
jgi:hypothetical protein